MGTGRFGCGMWCQRSNGQVFRFRGMRQLLLILSLVFCVSLVHGQNKPSASSDSNRSESVATQVTLQTPWRNSLPPAAIGFVGWNGWSTSPRNPENNAQAILAEPEVERFIQELIRRVGGIPRQAMSDAPPALRRAASRLTTNLVESFFLRSGCVYLERFTPPTDGNPPVIEACAWLEIGPQADTILADLKTLLADAPTEIGTTEIDGHTFLTMDADMGPETLILVGVVDECLVVSISESCVTDSLKRKAADKTPGWLTDAEANHGLAQLQGLGRFDFAKLWAQMLPAMMEMGLGEQELAIIRKLGIERLQSIETVDGFAQRHRIQRVQVNVEPGTGGIWSLFDGPGLRPEHLQHMPADTLFSNAFVFDGKRFLQFAEQFINEVDGPDSNPISEFCEEMYEETGVDLEEDLLDPLGDVWTIHNAAGDGWLSGLALTVSVDDPEGLSSGLAKLINSYSRETGDDPEMAKISQRKMGDMNVFTMSFPFGPIPVLPSWTIHNGRLMVTLFPDTLPAIAQAPDRSLLSSSSEVRSHFETSQDGDSILMLSYVDTQRQFEVLYPYAQMVVAMGSNAVRGLPGPDAESFGEVIDGLMLPSSRVIHRHLLPTVSVLKRNKSGFQLETQATLPIPDVTVMAPVAVGLLVPAVQQARVAAMRAQSSNNLKQIALACLNYESTYRRFPAAYNQSEDKQPLLSWRVHILPYIEQGNLYEQFRLDEPWDSPHNLALLEQMPETYRGPNSQAAPGHTVYLGVAGSDAAFGIPDQVGPQSAMNGQRISSVTDGLSNTILAVEVSDEMAVPWTKPDSEIDVQNSEPWRFYGQFPGGVNVVFCDGATRFMNYLDDAVWRALLQINDGVVTPSLDSDW
ncbi:MAG: DUF1559 domain-containing protein [Planctomycetaceae bacterium]|nr:DUF1559 domain-containing protein [Planctomycetaceae bacterium]